MRKNTIPKIWTVACFLCSSIFTEGQPPKGPLVVSPEIHGDKTVPFRYLAPSEENSQLLCVFGEANLNRHKGTKTRRKTSEICGFVS